MEDRDTGTERNSQRNREAMREREMKKIMQKRNKCSRGNTGFWWG